MLRRNFAKLFGLIPFINLDHYVKDDYCLLIHDFKKYDNDIIRVFSQIVDSDLHFWFIGNKSGFIPYTYIYKNFNKKHTNIICLKIGQRIKDIANTKVLVRLIKNGLTKIENDFVEVI